MQLCFSYSNQIHFKPNRTYFNLMKLFIPDGTCLLLDGTYFKLTTYLLGNSFILMRYTFAIYFNGAYI